MRPSLLALVLRVRLAEARAARRCALVEREHDDFRRLRGEVVDVERLTVTTAGAMPDGPDRSALFFALADLMMVLS